MTKLRNIPRRMKLAITKVVRKANFKGMPNYS